MAFEDDVLDIALLVTTDLSAAQYHFVMMSADNTVVICSHATNDNPIGVLQNKPDGSVTPAVARIRVMGVSRVMTGGVVGFGDKVGTDASGHGIAKTVDKTKFLGIAIDGAGASELASVLIQCGLRTISA